MFLSDISVTRPVFASVVSLLLLVFGVISFDRLPLREYPDIDPPIVSITTSYPGASASIVETRITEVLEQRVSGVEGIKFIQSSSQDGQSRITIEFNVGRDIEAAANDIRDQVAAAARSLPTEADPPRVQKVDSNDDVILWLNLVSDRMTIQELTDYAERYLVDRFSVLDGVGLIRVGGGQTYAMRIWLDREQMAARNLTAEDIERALRAENVELPAGSIESLTRQFTVRVSRAFHTADDFARLVIARGDDGYLVRLGDVARVERGAVESRIMFRGNGIPQVGIGVTKQSTANTVAVADAVYAEVDRLAPYLPDGMSIERSYDSSIFIRAAIKEVYATLFIAIALVVFVIYLFLGSVRATLIPAVTVPVSLISTFIVLYVLGFSINLLTLLALVLAIGLVVDDAIVVLENVTRHIREEGRSPLSAAFHGTRQVGFAVVATTLVLISVFVPITFLEGDMGRLFSEFAVTMAAAVAFSSLIALTLSAMLASKILKKDERGNAMTRAVDGGVMALRRAYRRSLGFVLRRPVIVLAVFAAMLGGTAWLFQQVPSEYAPREDRGAFFIRVSAPEGTSYAFIEEYMNEIESRLMPYIESGEISRLMVRAPGGFGNLASFNSGVVIAVLEDWSSRRSGWVIMEEIRQKFSDLPGVRAVPVMRQGFGSAVQKPVQFVIGGGSYAELAAWRDIIVEKIEENNPGFVGLDWDYKETKPQIEVHIDYDRAAALGVTITTIGRTLETMLGSRRVTTYIDGGEEYDVILEGEREAQRTATNMENIYVRSETSQALIPLSNLVTLRELADASSLNRYNRLRAITIDSNLADGFTLGQALDHLETLVREHLPEQATIDYKGLSRDYKFSGGSIIFVFLMGMAVVFLVLAAQFESYIHPLVIMMSVPLAMAGGLLGLYLTGNSLNIYSQIGLIVLVGLSAKNGILIVEFINQIRDRGADFSRAILEACEIRMRPIIMTAITTAAGAIPLILSSGAGAETRLVIGVVIMGGILVSTVFTLYVVPVAYSLMARGTGSPGDVKRRLLAEDQDKQSAQVP